MAEYRNAVAGPLYRLSSSTPATRIALAFFVLVVVPLHTAAESQVSVTPGPSKPAYTASALLDTYAFVRGTPGDSQEKQGLAWLDDHRVMFAGFTPGDRDSKGMYVWDVSTNDVYRYSNHTDFCFADGAVGPSPKRGDGSAPSSVRQGRIGNTQNLLCDSRSGKACRGRLNMSCEPSKYFGKTALGKYSKYVFELRTGDGAIVDPVDRLAILDQLRGKNLEEKKTLFNRPLLLVNEQFPKGKPLPITALEEVIAWKATYSKYGDHYVFVTERPKDGVPGYTSIWPPGLAQPVYLMGRDGQVEEIDVPPTASRSKIHLASIAVPGIVFLGTAAPRRGWGGLFLYDKHAVWQLDRGQPQTLAVSANGCKVAYAMDSAYDKKPTSYLRVKLITFC